MFDLHFEGITSQQQVWVIVKGCNINTSAFLKAVMGEKRYSWLPVSCMTGCNESQEKVWFLKKKKKLNKG